MTGKEDVGTSVQAIYFPPFRLDLTNEQLWRGTQLLEVRPKTFAVLRYLVEHPHRLVTREELQQALWPKTVGGERAPKQCMRELRQVLGEEKAKPRFIETIARRGWRFIGIVGSREDNAQRAGSKDQGAKIPRLQPPTPMLVGRDPELAQLHTWLAHSLQGTRQMVFVTGEPGIGKSTLVEAFQRQLANQGLWTGYGQCIEQHGAGEAFLPVLDALGRLARGAGGVHLIEILRTYAPMWLVQLPVFIDGKELETVQRKVHGASHERMLRELAEALERLAAEQPVILVLEDLHWSDVSTLDLLAFLARRKELARLLVIGTYRPVEMLSDGHPLQSVTQELYAHRLATELPLGLLSEADIAAYLEQRLSGGALYAPQQPLARLLHQRTGGNPLFLVSTVDELIAQGMLTRIDHAWTLRGEVADVGIAESIRQLVARQRGRLSAEERQTLAAASVAGMEFSAAAVAAALTTESMEIERHCEQLADRQHFLRRVGIEAWPDGTLAARYSFLHAMYQQFWHERVSPTQLQHYHLQIGQRKEHAYGEYAREIATELALHFEQGRDYRKAVQYLQHAGQRASQRSANMEAIQHLTKGLELLKTLPDTSEHMQLELTLQLTLEDALVAVRGYTAPEVEKVGARARALCRQIGQTPQLFSVLHRAALFYVTRGELQRARELEEEMLQLAHNAHDQHLLSLAQGVLGITLYWLGELTAARPFLEQALLLYTPQPHRAHTVGTADPRVDFLSSTAWTLWLLGYPAQALKRSQEAVAVATELDHPFSLAFALGLAASFHILRQEWEVTQTQAEAMLALSNEQGFPFWVAWGTIARGWALAAQGERENGIAQMQQGLAVFRAIGTEVGRPHWLVLLAKAHGKVAQAEAGLTVLAEAFAEIDKTGERWCEAELWRIKGELLLKAESGMQNGERQTENPGSDTAPIQCSSFRVHHSEEAEACFLTAIDIAHKQSAKSWELRATTSLARLWQVQGKHHEAHKKLSEVYNWFTEGFDTKDLQEANALLEELSH